MHEGVEDVRAQRRRVGVAVAPGVSVHCRRRCTRPNQLTLAADSRGRGEEVALPLSTIVVVVLLFLSSVEKLPRDTAHAKDTRDLTDRLD